MHNISIIVCTDAAGGMAKQKQIPWLHEAFTKDDLKNFKAITNGHICVMGRNTYNEILEHRKKFSDTIEELLPGRKSYVLTSKHSDDLSGYEGITGTARNLRHVFELEEKNINSENKKIFVIGGHKLYVESLAWANEVHVSIIDQSYNCDTFFPIASFNKFKITDGAVINEHMKYVKYTR